MKQIRPHEISRKFYLTKFVDIVRSGLESISLEHFSLELFYRINYKSAIGKSVILLASLI